MENTRIYRTSLGSDTHVLSAMHILIAWAFALLSGVATVAVFLRHLRWEVGL
jgi:hypothetical protein